MSSYSIDALSVLEKQALTKEACFIIGVWFYRGFNFKENHLALLNSAVSYLYNTNLELEKRNYLFTQLLNFNNDYVASFLSTISSPQIPSIQGVKRSSLDFFNQIIQPLPITPKPDCKEIQRIPQNKSPQESNPEVNPIIIMPIQYKPFPYSSAQNGQPAPIPQSTQISIPNQRAAQPVSPNYDQGESSPMKYELISSEGMNMLSDAPNGPSLNAATDKPRSISKSARKRQLKNAKKKMQLMDQTPPSPQLPQNSNPQQALSSFNPQQVPSSFNPQQVPSSFNPQQLISSPNPQQLPQSLDPQQFTPSFGSQHSSQFIPKPYIQPIPQPISQANPVYYSSSIPQSYYKSPHPNSIRPPPQETCSICMQEFKGSEILSQTYCPHRYHKECIATTLTEAINSGKVPIECLAGNCRFNIELPVIKAALPASVSKRYEDLSNRYAVSPSDRFEFGCPSCKAKTWVMKNVEQFACNGCKKYYCGRCMRDHPGYICLN